MPPLPPPSYTYFLRLLSDRLSWEIISFLVLDGPATQQDLGEELGYSSGQLSRHMGQLERAGVVVRERPHSPYELTLPQQSRALLQAVAGFADDLAGLRSQVDEDFRARLG